MLLDSTSIKIRASRRADLALMLEIYAPYIEKTAITFEETVPSLADFTQRWEKVTAFFPWLVAVDQNDIPLAYAYAGKFRERAAYRFVCESSIYCRQDAGGRGLGKALYTTLLNSLRTMGLQRVYGIMTLPNAASQALHEGFGFKPAGIWKRSGYKLGAWHDVAMFDLDLNPSNNDSQKVPNEPRAYEDTILV